MFQKGDRVVYGAHGVCVVVDTEERFIDRKKITYLVLEPVDQNGSRFFVPIHNATAMEKLRPVLTREELEKLFRSDHVRHDGWIRDDNLRKQTYRDLIARCDREALMNMVYTIYSHKATQFAAGKKVHQCDENFLRDAEKILSGEISVVMEIPYEQARALLREKLA